MSEEIQYVKPLTNEEIEKINLLVKALKDKNIEEAKLLLKTNELNLNDYVGSRYSDTIFHLAMETGNLDIIRLVIAKNVWIPASEFEYYIEKKNIQPGILAFLKTLPIYAKSELSNAYKAKDTEKVISIIRAGVDITMSELEYALEKATPDIIESLKNLPIYTRRNLLEAIRDNNIQAIKDCLAYAKNQNFDMKNLLGGIMMEKENETNMFSQLENRWRCEYFTPIHLAARIGNAEIIQLCIDYGADVDAKNSENQTPLHLASLALKTNAVICLIKNKANLDALVLDKVDMRGHTMLHHVAEMNNTEMTKVFIQQGAKVDTPECIETPLHLAALFGNLEVVKCLVDEHNADINASNYAGKTPFDLVKKSNVRNIQQVKKYFLEKLEKKTPASFVGYTGTLLSPQNLKELENQDSSQTTNSLGSTNMYGLSGGQ